VFLGRALSAMFVLRYRSYGTAALGTSFAWSIFS
jgi:hypothetical protein